MTLTPDPLTQLPPGSAAKVAAPVAAAAGESALEAEFAGDAAFDPVFVVLTVGATLLATQGLLADSAAVVIGAMVVAPWILPLQAMAFAILQGRLVEVLRAFRTLMLGVTICLGLSVALGLLVDFPSFGPEVLKRTSPNLLDLGIALVAGAIAMFAKLRREAITALAGLAIAVALVPPVCVVGLLLSERFWDDAWGASLLFATNLLGILVGAMAVLGTLEAGYRQRLLRSGLSLTSLVLTALLLIPLGGSFVSLVQRSRHEASLHQVEAAIRRSLANETISLGRDSQLMGVEIDWSSNPPLIRASVRVTNPYKPTSSQVAKVQRLINEQQAPLRFRLVMQRIAIQVIGPETAPNPPEALAQVVPPAPAPVEPAAPAKAGATEQPSGEGSQAAEPLGRG
ncbi:MAG TPA: DUF389 domain-containing protein [Cyanobium sp.]|nr:DUF389 domain-containing protein [Cyanobium sp.]